MGFSRQEYWSGVPLPSPKESLICKKTQKDYSAKIGLNLKKKEFQGMFTKLVYENIHSAFKAKFQFSRQTDISQTWMLGSS